MANLFGGNPFSSQVGQRIGKKLLNGHCEGKFIIRFWENMMYEDNQSMFFEI